MNDITRQEIAVILAYTKVAHSELFSPLSSRRIVRARRALARELRHRGLSYERIGHIIGRDHSTVRNLLGMKRRKF